MSAVRIVVTVPWARRAGGAESILWSFLRHLDRRRVDPLLVFFEQGLWEREAAAIGIRTTVIPTGRLRRADRMLSAVWRLSRLMRAERPALVLDWSSKTHLYGGAAAVASGLSNRVIWWQHGIPTWHWLDQVATLLPTRAIGTCSAAAAAGQRRIRPHRRVIVVAPGTDPPGEAAQEELQELRMTLRIPGERKIVGVVGRMEPGKRQDVVIRAVAALVGDGQDAHCLVVGGTAFELSPEWEPSLHELARELGLADRVTFTGQVSDANSYLQLMDVLASASISESFGMALVEAMALGVPVVAYDSGGPAEIIENGRSGILLSDQGPEALARELDRVLSDDVLRANLSRAGRERFTAEFTAARWTERLTELIESLARSPSG